MRDRSGVGVTNSSTNTGIKRMRVRVMRFGRLSDSCPTDLHAASTRFISNPLRYPVSKKLLWHTTEEQSQRMLKLFAQQGHSDLSLTLLRGGWDDPNCAHRTSTVLSCAFCEHWDRPSYPDPFFSILFRRFRVLAGRADARLRQFAWRCPRRQAW